MPGSKEFVYKFQSKAMTGKKIPYTFLKNILKEISGIAKDVSKINDNPTREIDFNVEIREGSTAVVLSALNEEDVITDDALSNTALLIASISDETTPNEYLRNDEVRCRVHRLLRSSYGIADSLEVLRDSTALSHTIQITKNLVEEYRPFNSQESYVEYIAKLHRLDSKLMRLGFSVPNIGSINVRFSAIHINELKKLFNQFIYVKIDNAVGLPNAQSRVHAFRNLPGLDSELTIPELRDNFLQSSFKLDEIRRLPSGWDGYQGAPIPSSVVDVAYKLLKQIFLLVEYFELRQEFPHVVPVPNGNIQFEWDSDMGSLEIEFNDNEFEVYEVRVVDGEDVEKEFVVRGYEEVLDSIFRYLNE